MRAEADANWSISGLRLKELLATETRVRRYERALREIAPRPLIYGHVVAEICREALEAGDES